jgi:hypothetical protein
MFGNNSNTAWNTFILVKLTGPQIVKKIEGFITTFTPPAPILSQIIPDHAPLHSFKINFTIINPFTPRPSTLSLSLGHPHQNRIGVSPLPLRATRLAHRILLDFIT